MRSSSQLSANTDQDASGGCGRFDLLVSKARILIIFTPSVGTPFRIIIFRISIASTPTTI
jgi:hypothetical protein